MSDAMRQATEDDQRVAIMAQIQAEEAGLDEAELKAYRVAKFRTLTSPLVETGDITIPTFLRKQLEPLLKKREELTDDEITAFLEGSFGKKTLVILSEAAIRQISVDYIDTVSSITRPSPQPALNAVIDKTTGGIVLGPAGSDSIH